MHLNFFRAIHPQTEGRIFIPSGSCNLRGCTRRRHRPHPKVSADLIGTICCGAARRQIYAVRATGYQGTFPAIAKRGAFTLGGGTVLSLPSCSSSGSTGVRRMGIRRAGGHGPCFSGPEQNLQGLDQEAQRDAAGADQRGQVLPEKCEDLPGLKSLPLVDSRRSWHWSTTEPALLVTGLRFAA